MLFAEEPIPFQLPFVGGATLTLDEMHELVSLIQSEHSANSNSLIQSKHSANSNSGSDTNRSVYSVEEQKLRRMISNQKSARQSRLRKKMHLENLTNQVNRLRIENRELKNRLSLVSRHYQYVTIETDWLQTESLMLQQKLAGLYQLLAAMNFH